MQLRTTKSSTNKLCTDHSITEAQVYTHQALTRNESTCGSVLTPSLFTRAWVWQLSGQDLPRSAGSVMLTPCPVRWFMVHNGH